MDHGTQRRKDPLKNLVGCRVGDVSYALPIGVVREIVNPLAVIALPGAPPGVRGVADFRDIVVPVVDLRVRFGVPDTQTRRTKWIIVEGKSRVLALVVDSVTGVFRSGELRDAPRLGAGDKHRGIEGVTTHDGALVFVVDATRLEELVADVEVPS
ncbi:chemotaxis protein CheW [soil metagenome]